MSQPEESSAKQPHKPSAKENTSEEESSRSPGVTDRQLMARENQSESEEIQPTNQPNPTEPSKTDD